MKPSSTPDYSGKNIPVDTPFYKQVEGSRYELRYLPPGQADAFWLPANLAEARACVEKQKKRHSVNAGYIWFNKEQAGAMMAADAEPAAEKQVDVCAGVCGRAALSISKTDGKPAYLSGLLQDVIELCELMKIDAERPLGISLQAAAVDLEYGIHHKNGVPATYEDAAVERFSGFGFLFRKPEHIPREDRHIRAVCEHISRFPAGGGSYAWLFGRAESPEIYAQPEPETLIHGSAELSVFVPVRHADAADIASV